MSVPLDETVAHLRALVACDTRNPPRHIDTGGIFVYLREALPGFAFTVADSGDGCVSLLAVRGEPEVVFNFHIDTVPANPQWSRDPLALAVDGERATGLGACDIKGAAACMLTAARRTNGDLALLFSSDEEAGDSRCIPDFLATSHGFARAVVAEPTGARAVLAHRGYASVRATFRGIPGHASAARALDDSAVHRAANWVHAALGLARARAAEGFQGLSGIRLNVGRIEGGQKSNMIAADATLDFGIRPPPDQDPESLLGALRELAPAGHLAGWQPRFLGPALPGTGGERALASARELAAALGLELGAAVDFWSEAALFGAAGITAIVFGPGDIAQAHAADEWVALAQLEAVTDAYMRWTQR